MLGIGVGLDGKGHARDNPGPGRRQGLGECSAELMVGNGEVTCRTEEVARIFRLRRVRRQRQRGICKLDKESEVLDAQFAHSSSRSSSGGSGSKTSSTRLSASIALPIASAMRLAKAARRVAMNALKSFLSSCWISM